MSTKIAGGDLAVGHGAAFEVHEHRVGHKSTAGGLIVLDVDALELQVGGADIVAGGVNVVLDADHQPEFGADLITAPHRAGSEGL